MTLKKKSILLITRFFPPTNNASIYRMIGFTRYFEEAGFKVYVVTARHQVGEHDPTLLKMLSANVEIITTSTWKPSESFNNGNGTLSKVIKKRFKYLEKKYFPVDRYVFWVFPAIFASLRLVKANGIDYALITSPPHSTQWISILLKLLSKVLVISDYRDGSLHGFHHRRNGTIPGRIELFTERLTIKYADLILANTPTNKSLLVKDYPDSIGKTLVVMNGYLEEDLVETKFIKLKFEKLRIAYTGEFYPDYIDSVLDVFTELYSKDQELADHVEIHCAGLITDYDLGRINTLGLNKIIIHHGFLSYSDTKKLINTCNATLLVQPNSKNIGNVIPSKLFFYIGNNKPIIAFMPKGDATDVINHVNAGVIMPIDDIDASVKKMREIINSQFLIKQQFKENIKQYYSRRTQSYILINYLRKALIQNS